MEEEYPVDLRWRGGGLTGMDLRQVADRYFSGYPGKPADRNQHRRKKQQYQREPEYGIPLHERV